MANPTAVKITCTTALFLVLLATAAPAQQLTGKGEWHSLSSAIINGKWAASLTRTGNHLAGTLKLGRTDALSGGTVSGDINASSIVLGVMADDIREVTFTGKLDGDSVKGEWDCPALKDHGVWFGTLTVAAAAQ
jgi:hypothetical protein